METIDLGLVLPLWDDALPQVAIEFICHGVPILVSDRGGQGELACDPAFIFSGGSSSEFWLRLKALYDDPSLFARFWEVDRPLRTMRDHVPSCLKFMSRHAGTLKRPCYRHQSLVTHYCPTSDPGDVLRLKWMFCDLDFIQPV